VPPKVSDAAGMTVGTPLLDLPPLLVVVVVLKVAIPCPVWPELVPVPIPELEPPAEELDPNPDPDASPEPELEPAVDCACTKLVWLKPKATAINPVTSHGERMIRFPLEMIHPNFYRRFIHHTSVNFGPKEIIRR
jgi:hypothetical protein